MSDVRVRPAVAGDAEALARLAAEPSVARVLSPATPRDAPALRAWIEGADGRESGRLTVEAGGEVVGGLVFETRSRRSRIAVLSGVMVDPAARGRGVGEAAVRAAVELLTGPLGFHRVELEAYAFNEEAVRLFERCGFVREGVRRRAYWRHGAWQDSVMCAYVAEES